MKKIIISLFLLSSLCFAFDISECYQIFSADADSLFMSAISALYLSDKYQIVEVQSKNGYILFLYGTKYYLLTLTKRYQNQSEIKILPQNSEYSDGAFVAQEVFALINDRIKQNPMGQIK